MKEDEQELELVSLVEKPIQTTPSYLEYEDTPPSTPIQPNNDNTKSFAGFTTAPPSLAPDATMTITPRTRRRSSCLLLLSILSLLIGLAIVHFVGTTQKDKDPFVENHVYPSNQIRQNDRHERIHLSCPTLVEKAKNDKDGMVGEFYDEQNHIVNDTSSDGHDEDDNHDDGAKESQGSEEEGIHVSTDPIDVESLKNTVYDGWSGDYHHMKKVLYDWKKTYFSSLQSGDKLFEVSHEYHHQKETYQKNNS